MTQFDQEMKFFKEIKNKYTPIADFHMVLDLDAYKLGQEIIHKYRFDSEEYHFVVNIDAREKNKEIVIITSNGDGYIEYDSHNLYLMHNYRKNLILDLYDKSPSPYQLKRSLKHEMIVLAYELAHPKPEKPVC